MTQEFSEEKKAESTGSNRDPLPEPLKNITMAEFLSMFGKFMEEGRTKMTRISVTSYVVQRGIGHLKKAVAIDERGMVVEDKDKM